MSMSRSIEFGNDPNAFAGKRCLGSFPEYTIPIKRDTL